MKMRNAVRCEQCSEIMDAEAPGNAKGMTGYSVNRSQGGANMIACAEPTGTYLCRTCLDLRRAGRRWAQPSLFDS